jgi:hypothetical protein
MRSPSSLILSLPLCLIPAVALAQTAPPAGQAPIPAAPVAPTPVTAAPVPAAAAKPPATAAGRQQQMDAEDEAQQEIVVTGQRPAGSVIGDIPPEVTLSPADIRAYGVNNISDLLDQLTAQTGSGRGSGAPVVLLNGRRISSFAEIRDLPTEAILRTEILPEEVSLKYGYSADQRVVNIVLRPRFRAKVGQGGGSIATAGGGASANPEANLIRIDHDKRLSINLRYQYSAAIKESERDLTPLTTSFLPTVTDFGSNPSAVPDASDDRTLRASSQQFSANVVYAHPVLTRATLTLNGSLSYTHTDALNGLIGGTLDVPAANPFATSTNDAAVSHYLSDDPLHQRAGTLTGHLGVSLNGDRGHWRWSLTGNYDYNQVRTHTQTGLDLTAAQTQIDALSATINPYAALPSALVGGMLTNRATSTSNAGNLQAVVGGPLFHGPAGSIATNIKVGLEETGFDASSLRYGGSTAASAVAQSSSLTRRNGNGQINLDIPLASRRENFLPFLGSLSANFNAAVSNLSDFGTLHTIGYGLFWQPDAKVNLIVSQTIAQDAPTIQQLGNPTILTPQVRVFDYQSGTTVDVTQIDGGNRSLAADERHTLKIGLTLKPLAKSDLTVIANYVHTKTDNEIASLPSPTASIEAAFPSRFVRDASGQLVSVDVRSVNFDNETEDSIRMGFNFSIPLKSILQRKFEQYIADRRAGKNVPFPIKLPQLTDAQRKRFEQMRERAGVNNGNSGQGNGQAGNTPPPPPPPSGDGAPPPPPPGGFGGQGGPGGGPGGGFGGPGGGGPGGPGGGGFRGGGGFARNSAGRLQIAVYDQWTLKDTVQIRPGVPIVDLLHGGSITGNGGTPEHKVEVQLGYSNNGLGVRLSGNWQSGTTVTAGPGSTTGDLDFSPLTTATLRIFADFGQMPTFIGKGWARGLRATFTLSNITNERQKVRDENGNTPVRYQPAYLDPLGRTVGITIRKLWL